MANAKDYVKTRADYDSNREKASITQIAQANNTIQQQNEILKIITEGDDGQR